MLYQAAADVVALVHFAFIAFVIFGAALGLRSRWWRLAHLAAMGYGVLIEVFYWYCPLTLAEQWLRRRAGAGAYDEPFIAHYLNEIIYIDVSQWMLIAAAAAVLGVNCALYLRPRARPRPREIT